MPLAHKSVSLALCLPPITCKFSFYGFRLILIISLLLFAKKYIYYLLTKGFQTKGSPDELGNICHHASPVPALDRTKIINHLAARGPCQSSEQTIDAVVFLGRTVS